MMELIPENIFSENDLQILLPRLCELMRKQTEWYTLGDSTSVTVETAQRLLSSLWYTITTALDETGTPYNRLLSDELLPLVSQGQAILREKLKAAKRLWKAVCRTSPEIQNFYYTNTLHGIRDYLEKYDPYYYAHKKPSFIDYPLLNAPSDEIQGITYTEQYLWRMLAENTLIHGFEQDAVVSVLQTVTPEYQDYYLNLCEQPLTNALGLALTGGNVRTLHPGYEEYTKIKEVIHNRSGEKLRESLQLAVITLCEQMRITDKWIIDYVTVYSETLLPRIEAASEEMDLSNIFIL